MCTGQTAGQRSETVPADCRVYIYTHKGGLRSVPQEFDLRRLSGLCKRTHFRIFCDLDENANSVCVNLCENHISSPCVSNLPFIFSQKCHRKAPFNVWISKFSGGGYPRTPYWRIGEADPTGGANGSFQNATRIKSSDISWKKKTWLRTHATEWWRCFVEIILALPVPLVVQATTFHRAWRDPWGGRLELGFPRWLKLIWGCIFNSSHRAMNIVPADFGRVPSDKNKQWESQLHGRELLSCWRSDVREVRRAEGQTPMCPPDAVGGMS